MAIKGILISPHIFRKKNSVGFVERALLDSLSDNIDIFCYADETMHAPFIKNTEKVKCIKRNKLVLSFNRILFYLGLSEFVYPDQYYWAWGKKVFKDIDRIFENNQIDYIQSDSLPCSDHVIAYQLKKRYHVKWVADFYDPWCGNPFRGVKFANTREKDFVWEKRVVENADLVLVNSQKYKELLVNRHGAKYESKIEVFPMAATFPNGHAELETNPPVVHFVQIGNSYGKRTSLPFLKALNNVLFSNPDFRGKIKVDYIGTVTKEEKEYIMGMGYSDIVKIHGVMSEEACVEYYNKANVFLAVDADLDGFNYFFPSKILKYFYFRRPILGITPDDSVLHDELKATGHFVTNANDTKHIEGFITQCVTNYSSLLSFSKSQWEKYEKKNVAIRYEEMIKNLLSTKEK